MSTFPLNTVNNAFTVNTAKVHIRMDVGLTYTEDGIPLLPEDDDSSWNTLKIAEVLFLYFTAAWGMSSWLSVTSLTLTLHRARMRGVRSSTIDACSGIAAARQTRLAGHRLHQPRGLEVAPAVSPLGQDRGCTEGQQTLHLR